MGIGVENIHYCVEETLRKRLCWSIKAVNCVIVKDLSRFGRNQFQVPGLGKPYFDRNIPTCMNPRFLSAYRNVFNHIL